jgi:hypothetical protein
LSLLKEWLPALAFLQEIYKLQVGMADDKTRQTTKNDRPSHCLLEEPFARRAALLKSILLEEQPAEEQPAEEQPAEEQLARRAAC